jgi:hypothetical protein
MSIRKSSIQEAILQAKEIESSALAKAKKALEEELAPKIKAVANEALKELEKDSLNENMSIEIPDNAELTIKMPNGEATAVDVTDVENGEVENTDSDTEVEELPNDELTNNEDDMEDIFEIEDIFEEVPAPAAAPDASAAPAPAETPEAAATPEIPVDAPDTESATIETVNQKLDDVLAKLETLSGEESVGDTEGEVAIIDDEQPAEPAVAPAPEAAPAEAPIQEDEFELEDDSDEVVYEMEDEEPMEDEVVYELEEDMNEMDSNSMMEIFNELQQLDELEIVDEDEEIEEETMEEDSHTTRHRTSQRGKITKKLPMSQDAPRSQAALKESIDKIKAQYGSKVDELTKENESLKQTLKEYKESFVVLRKQINEVQIFNAKLAYANKLFANGGLTNDEKARIAEEFDKVETIEEAKKIYNSLLSEMKTIKSPVNNVEKIRSANPAVIKPSTSTSHTLMESDEIRRMKRLAGLTKREEN